MQTTMTLATNLHCSPFEIFDQDMDEVIMTINFYLIKAKTSEHTQTKTKTNNMNIKKKEQRIHVDDRTATGGWF